MGSVADWCNQPWTLKHLTLQLLLKIAKNVLLCPPLCRFFCHHVKPPTYFFSTKRSVPQYACCLTHQLGFIFAMLRFLTLSLIYQPEHTEALIPTVRSIHIGTLKQFSSFCLFTPPQWIYKHSYEDVIYVLTLSFNLGSFTTKSH